VGSTYNVAEETGEWSTAQPGVVIVTPSNNSTTVENLPLGETRFTWTITKGTCDPSTAEIAVYNHSFAEGDVYAGPNQLDNCTDIATMDATAIPSGGTGVWTRLSGTGVVTLSTNPTSGVTNLTFG
jgi:hypothetical protein